jgi:Synergist-CTERM protein sorting domain-containing protein
VEREFLRVVPIAGHPETSGRGEEGKEVLSMSACGKTRCARVLILLGVLILAFVTPVFADAGRVAPLNPDYLAYRQQVAAGALLKTRTESGHPLGYRPAPTDLSHIDPSTIVFPGLHEKVTPDAYDLRTYGYVTAVRDQNPYGTCWAFGTMASLESTFKKATGDVEDFSEWHLAYFVYQDESLSKPSFTQDVVEAGKDPIFDQGGNVWQATALLARWSGAVDEADRPYQNVKPWPDASRPLATDPVAKHLEHVYYLGAAFNAATVKGAILAYGAVAVRILWNHAAFNSATNAYYNAASTGIGHIVTIVGWDDAYAATNFGTDPGSNGAWIVKNSWGTSWGASGYFYLSYAEPTLGYPAVFVGADKTNFDRIYDYDPLGRVTGYGYTSETGWFANVFTSHGVVLGASAATQEVLKAVAFYAMAANATFRIEIWTGGIAGNPMSGTRQLVHTGTLQVPGYHTVRLPQDVVLPVGTRFAVVVELTTPGYTFPIPIENPEVDYSDKASALADQSYVSAAGTTWTDMTTAMANTNVCLKAFTTFEDVPVTPTVTGTITPTLSPTHGGGGGGGGCDMGMAPGLVLLLLPVALFLKK